MRPTIGRIVHYFTTPHTASSAWGPVVPAIITAVHSETCVNLRVFPDCDEHPAHLTSVVRGDSFGQWNWPERDERSAAKASATAAP